MDSFYIEDNHSPIISTEAWEQVRIEMQKRAEAKGIFEGTDKYQNRYSLSGMFYCSNYVKNGKDACPGTKIDDEVISRLDLKEPMVVKEGIKNGKKHYSYTSKSKQE